MITAVPLKSLPAPRFKYCPVVQAGPFVQISGMVGIDPATDKLVAGGPGPETRQILQNLRNALEEMRFSFEDIFVARIFTTSMARFDEVNREWDSAFKNQDRLPARTGVGVSALPVGATVEIEFQMYKG